MHSGGGVGESPGAIKQQVIGLIHAVSYLKGRPNLASVSGNQDPATLE